MAMVPRNKTAEDMIEAAKKMPSGALDRSNNPINSEAVKQAQESDPLGPFRTKEKY